MTNQFELIRIFCVAAETGNFREAAASLGKSPQAVTRAIKELEEIRGEILFYRNTRKSKITHEGEELARRSKVVLNEIDGLLNTRLIEAKDEISGHIRLTLPTSLGRQLVMPALGQFQKEYPRITLSCTLTDSHSNVIDEQIDIGLRTGFLRDNRFVARKVLDVSFYLVGSQELIQRTGAPRKISHLSQLPIVALLDNQTGRYWPWGFDEGRNFIPSSPRFVTDDLDAYGEALLAGIGFGHIPGFLALPWMKSGKLVPVMQEIKSSSWGLYLFRPQAGPVPARIRVLYDFLYEYLKTIKT